MSQSHNPASNAGTSDHPLLVLMQHFDDQGADYEFDDEDGTVVTYLDLDSALVRSSYTWLDDDRALKAECSFDIKTRTPKQFARVTELLALINALLRKGGEHGAFEYVHDEREVTFAVVVDCADGDANTIETSHCDALIHVLGSTMQRWFDPIMSVRYANVSAKTAFRNGAFDTTDGVN